MCYSEKTIAKAPDWFYNSSRPVVPFGRWYFYEQVLKVPVYVIFYPDLGLLELYNLTDGR
jgi:hypothetical protein